MATTSEIKSGLDAIASSIEQCRNDALRAKELLDNTSAVLQNLATAHADVISTVNGFTPAGAFQELSKDELAKLTTEFQSLKSAVDAASSELE